MTRTARLSVLFVAAAGPRRGFGHLVRCGVLADALGARRQVALRASSRTRRAARNLGWTVLAPSLRSLASRRPDLLVIDDPSSRHTSPWVRAAQSLDVPVASVHDLGLGRVAADLTIDGSPVIVRGVAPADLQGPAFAILDPVLAVLRARPPARRPGRVLIALGGGAHVRTLGADLAARVVRAFPDATVDLASGFAPRRVPVSLPAGCRWIHAPAGLARALATASVAIVAGGLTLYEACALGTPVVALAVAAPQRPTIRAFAAAGAALDATSSNRNRTLDRAAALAANLLASPHTAARQSLRALQLVDGRGTLRVVGHLRTLTDRSLTREDRHVA